MRCARCKSIIKPENSTTDAKGFHFGPVCAVRLGLVKPKRPRQQGKLTIFGKTAPIRIDDGQIDFFEVAA